MSLLDTNVTAHKGLELSVIIPVLNMENTIERTLMGLISQIQEDIDSVEIIVLDDSSTDTTIDIVRKFSNVVLVEHNERISTGALRNEGIALATKPFIAFLDGDDIMHLDVARNLITIMGYTADIGLAGYNRVDFKSGNLIAHRPGVHYNIQKSVVARTSELYPVLFNVCNAACWNKIFNADFLAKNSIRFSDGCYAEDMCFTRCAMLKSNKYCYISDSLVDYSEPASNLNSTDASSATSGAWRDLFPALRTVFNALKESRAVLEGRDYLCLLHSFAVDCIGHITYQYSKFPLPCEEFSEQAMMFLREINEETDYCKQHFKVI